MIYFDNSATTYQKPKEVLRAFVDGITTYSANPGRSGHSLSMHTAEKIFNVRQQLCKFLGACSPEHIIFTQNSLYIYYITLISLYSLIHPILILSLSYRCDFF